MVECDRAMVERSRCPFSGQDRGGRRPARTVTLRAWLFRFWLGISILSPPLVCRGQEAGAPEKPKSAEAAPGAPAPPAPADDKRTELNLLGKTEVQAGGSRPNEKVQFNLVDNNAPQELNARPRCSATVTPAFPPALRYFGTEFGNKASRPS